MNGVVLLGNRTAEVHDFSNPEPAPGEVRIRVQCAGICGSDLHYYRSSPEELGIRRGVVIGHEPSGVIDAVGPGCRMVREGDRVTVNHTIGCGRCEYCRRGETVLCEENLGIAARGRGGDAEYVVLPEENVYPLPDDLSVRDGAFLACTGATAWGALRKLALAGGRTLAVFGLGPVGLSGVLLAKGLGLRVVAVDVNSERLSFAKHLGADHTVTAGVASDGGRPVADSRRSTAGFDEGSEVTVAVRELTGGRGADGSFETSGSAAGQRDAVRCLAQRGRAVFVGLSDGAPTVSPEMIIHRELTLLGSKVLPGPDIFELCRFLGETGTHFDSLVTHGYPLSDGPRAFREFDAGAPGKFVLDVVPT